MPSSSEPTKFEIATAICEQLEAAGVPRSFFTGVWDHNSLARAGKAELNILLNSAKTLHKKLKDAEAEIAALKASITK